MNIRKFEANSFEEALNRVKTELGPEALILASEEKRRGWFQKPIVEITAAFSPSPEKEWDDNALEKVFPHRRRTPEQELAVARAKKQEAPASAMLRVPVQKAERNLTSVERSFNGMGLADETSREFARQVIFDYPKKDRDDAAFLEKIQMKLLSAGLRTLGPDVFQTRRCWAAVGSSGVGKTSLLVKLALALKGRGLALELTSCDNRKVVGRQELAAYAKLIGVPFVSGTGLERKANQLALFDTPSINWDQPHLFKDVEKHCRDASTVIVLDASQRLNELLRTVDRLSPLAPVALAFTRLDLVSQAGVIYDVVKQTKLPLLGCSVSHSFSTGFRFFESGSLARYLVQKVTLDEERRLIVEAAAEHGQESVV